MKLWIHVQRRLLVPLLLCLSVATAWAQERAESVAEGTPGTEYFIAFPRSDRDAQHQFMGLMITSEVATTGVATIPIFSGGEDTIVSYDIIPFTVRPGETTMIEVPRTLEPEYIEEHTRRTVHVTSRAPIAISATSARRYSSGSWSVLPIQSWGTQYHVSALPAAFPSDDQLRVTGQIMITAAYDETKVTIRSAAKTQWFAAGQQVTIDLNRGQSFLIQADAKRSTPGTHDLSGTLISATKPVGVVAGHVSAALSANPNEQLNYKNIYSAFHATAQLPEDAWGKKYFTVPMRSTGDRFRLMALEDGTTVTAKIYRPDGVHTMNISLPYRGQVVDRSDIAGAGVPLDAPIEWSSSNAFALTQLRLSAGGFGNPENSPAMLRVAPAERWSSHSVIALPSSIGGGRFENFTLRVIARGSDNPLAKVLINGTPASDLAIAAPQQIGDAYAATVSLAPGGYVLTATDGVTFNGFVSGDNGNVTHTTLTWELPFWMPKLEADITAPRVLTTTVTSTTSLRVQVTDRTESYFSGVAAIELYESPDWNRDSFYPPADPDQDAVATFSVRAGVDPAGPLTVKLIDRSGNEQIVRIDDGVCLRTAYPDRASLKLSIAQIGAVAEEVVKIQANPCGDAANVTGVKFIDGGEANAYLEAPIVEGSTTIAENGELKVIVRSIAGLEGKKTYKTTLEVTVDGHTWQIPIELQINTLPTDVPVAGNGNLLLLSVAPNPSFGSATVAFGRTVNDGRLEILDALGRIVRTYNGAAIDGRDDLTWDGRDAVGGELPAGLYFVRLTADGGNATGSLVKTR